MKTKEVKTSKTATEKARKTVKILTPEQKADRLAKYQASPYFLEVNDVNSSTKAYLKSIKGSRAALLSAKSDGKNALTANFTKILKASKNEDAIFKHMTANVRAYSSGTYGTHTLLQYLRKNEAELLDMLKK